MIEEQEQLVRLKEMLQSQHIRLEAQQRANPYSLSSVRLWERLIKATEREIQRLESHAPYPQIGGHTFWVHPALTDRITISGSDGDDAKPYQEKDVRQVLKKAKEAQ